MAVANAGDCFLLTGVGRVPTPHLWVVLWGPSGAADSYLAAFLTTLRPYSDRTCVLDAGDHPFVRHPTGVAYRDVLRWSDERLSQLIEAGIAKPRPPMDSHVLDRVRSGFFASAHTPHALLEMAVREFGAVPPG